MGLNFYADKVILTSGTFLGGVIHIGQSNFEGGRAGDAPSNPLSRTLRAYDLGVGRLKTGTPPRLDGRTIDFSVLQAQPGDTPLPTFSIWVKHQIIHSRSPVTLPIPMKKPMILSGKV